MNQFDAAVMWAAKHGYDKVLASVLKKAKRPDYGVAMKSACFNGFLPIIKLLRPYTRLPDVWPACYYKRLDIVEYLLNNGERLSQHDFEGLCSLSTVPMLTLLVTKNNSQITERAIAMACSHQIYPDNVEVVSWLLMRGAPAESGITAANASRNLPGFTDILTLLLAYGATPPADLYAWAKAGGEKNLTDLCVARGAK